MNHRREILQWGLASGGALALEAMSASEAFAYERSAFEAKTWSDALKVLGASLPTESKDVQLNAPDIAENGAVVPVGITTTLKATQMAILVEKNPSTLAAQFFIPTGTEPMVTTRIKMAQTSNVYALVKADGKWSMAVKEIKVTLGGCGG